MRFRTTAVLGWLCAGGALVALAACGSTGQSSSDTGVGQSSKVVDIYSSLPLRGAAAARIDSMVNGIRLALALDRGKAGRWTVRYQSLDDSVNGTGNWDPNECAANARDAAADPNVVYYIGDFDANCSEVSIPILNLAGVPQVSPAAEDPRAYYPTGRPSFLRLLPNSAVQAAADLIAMKQAGCKRVAVASDGETYGARLATMLELEKGYYGIDIVSDTTVNPNAPDYASYAAMIKAEGADCFELSGIALRGGVQITEDVNAAIPGARIFAPDGMCTSTWTNPSLGGVPKSIGQLIECTAAVQDLSAYPAGEAFLAAYKARYGVSNPDPYAIYGYEAMKLGLDTIASLGTHGNSKAAVLRALFATTDRSSVLGAYGFTPSGDTTLRSYGLYRVGPTGNLVFFKTITPTRTVS